MSYLLDTHTIIWYFEHSAELPQKVIDENIQKYDVDWVWQ